ncbi:hypothetical protein [Pseudomonas sp. TCU-HL1]|uniref:hypothetical protein n=1 Tax=Pseudomonas sp. TCU-HL1 TaxID=1856685 RepID=UPI00083E6B79|nr:hypothetical protein [Pseudomonas sp. TCU-HL1]AOE83184.1 cytochrome C biogenesis protein [Pseudomonas sp. TCU-HL1]
MRWTSVTAIYASLEGAADVELEGNAGSTKEADYTRNAMQLRQGFRELTPENQRLTLEFVRMLQRLQREAPAG